MSGPPIILARRLVTIDLEMFSPSRLNRKVRFRWRLNSPEVLRHLLPAEFYERRKIAKAVNILTSLELMLTVVAEFLVGPIVATTHDAVIRVNVPIGLAGIPIGAYSLVARRAIPQLIGILATGNGAFSPLLRNFL